MHSPKRQWKTELEKNVVSDSYTYDYGQQVGLLLLHIGDWHYCANSGEAPGARRQLVRIASQARSWRKTWPPVTQKIVQKDTSLTHMLALMLTLSRPDHPTGPAAILKSIEKMCFEEWCKWATPPGWESWSKNDA